MRAPGGLSRPSAWVLSRLLPAELAGVMAGDLEERLRGEIRPTRGRVRAELWVWGQILMLRLPSLWGLSRRRGGAHAGAGTLSDLRHAARGLQREPGFAFVVVITLGIAIGATTLAFTVVDAVLLRSLPWADAGRLVQVHTTNAALRSSDSEMLRSFADRMPVSYPQMMDWSGRSDLFVGIGAIRGAEATLELEDGAERVSAPRVSGGLFETLGVQPALGRTFSPDEDRVGGDRAAVLSWGTFQRRFGGDPGVLGRTVRVDGEAHVIVGVMPRGFWFPDGDAELWTTLRDTDRNDERLTQSLAVVARLGGDVSAGRAQAGLDRLAEQLADTYADQVGFGARVAPVREEIVGGVEQTLLVLFGAVALVLVVACTNVANLMLARSTVRGREFALRSALGAGTARLLRAGFSEGLLLALAGGIVGLVLAVAGLQPLLGAIPDTVPRLDEVHLDARVFAFTATVSMAAAALVGMLPAWRAARSAPHMALQESGRTATHSQRTGGIQSALVLAQVAVSVVLIVGGVLLATSYSRLLDAERGFDPDGLALWTLSLPISEYADPARAQAAFSLVEERVGGLPGVTATAWATEAPFSSGLRATTLRAPDAVDPSQMTVDLSTVTPDFFEILGIPVLDGRVFEPTDDATLGPVVVSRAFADRFWPGESALGRVVLTGSDDTPRTVVGVVGDVTADARQAPGPKLYVGIGGGPRRILVMRTSLTAAPLASVLRTIARELDPDIPPREPVLLSRALHDSIAAERLRAVLIGALAAVAGLLAMLGVYGLMAYRVAGRLPEIGLRLALGAGESRVVRSVVVDGARLAISGTLIGLLGAAATARVIASFLFGVAPLDGPTYLATGLLLPATAALACWLPARRAAGVDPARVLTRT